MAGCIFCGCTPVTRTHVLGEAWVERLLPFEGQFQASLLTHDPLSTAESAWQSSTFDLSPKVACDPCNSGWMDRLDKAAEQIVEPAVFGHSITIRKLADQRIVATWVSLVSMLLDQTQAHPVVPSQMHQDFRHAPKPIDGLHVWLGRASPDYMIGGWIRTWLTEVEPGKFTEHPNLCLATIRIMELVIQALIPLDAAARKMAQPTSEDERRGFVRQLWPSPLTPVTWPPAGVVPTDRLDDFATRFDPYPS